MCVKKAFMVAVVLLLAFLQNAWSDDWPMFHHDKTLTGRSTGGGPEDAGIKWSYTNKDRGYIRTPAAIVGGKVYCGDDKGYMYCFNASDGSIVWEYFANHSFGKNSPCVDNGKVYIGTDAGIIYCFDAAGNSNKSTTVYWYYDTDLSYPSPPVVHNGYVYFGVEEWVYCLDTSGNLVWRYYGESGDHIFYCPSVYNDRLYVSSDNTAVRCLPLTDPDASGIIEETEIYWKYAGNGGMGSPVVVSGKIYVSRNKGGSEAGVSRIDIASHNEDKYYPAGGYVWWAPAVSAGYVHFGSTDKKFYCYDVDIDSVPDWTYDVGKYIQCSPAVSVDPTGQVYFTAGNNNLYCLMAYSQEADVIWIDTSHCYTNQSPAIAGGILYIGGSWHDFNAYGPGSSQATTNAYCISEMKDVAVTVDVNGIPSGSNTPYTFVFESPATIAVPENDGSGHPFKRWSTGQTDPSITVSTGGVYTAYYQMAASGLDEDSDGIPNLSDNCPDIFNPDQIDTDGDGIGDKCEARRGDFTGDGIVNFHDLAVLAQNWLNPLLPECWYSSTQCHGDANGDGIVNEADADIMTAAYGATYPDFQYNPCADFNRDGSVNAIDLATLGDAMGTTPPTDCAATGTWPPTP